MLLSFLQFLALGLIGHPGAVPHGEMPRDARGAPVAAVGMSVPSIRFARTQARIARVVAFGSMSGEPMAVKCAAPF